METKANYSHEEKVSKAKVSVPGGIAGEVHENSIQEKVGKKKFHPFLEEKIHPFILNIYKDYSVTGYVIMFMVSFVAVCAVAGSLLLIYLLFN